MSGDAAPGEAGPSGQHKAGLALVLGLAALECVLAARAYRSTIAPADTQALRQRLASAAELPMVVDRPWLDPLARAEFANARASYGLPDLSDAREFWVLGRPGDPAWSPALTAQHRLAAEPFLVDRFDAGGLSLSRLSQGDRAARRVDHLVDREQLEVRVDGRRCRGTAGNWDCRPGRVQLRYVEVEHQARRCLALEDFDGRQIEVRAKAFTFGDRLVGHVGFADFNGRLRSESDVQVGIEIAGQGESRFAATDAQGWAAFEVPTQRDQAELRVTLRPTLGGTYDAQGQYTRRPAHVVCIEVRALDADAPDTQDQGQDQDQAGADDD